MALLACHDYKKHADHQKLTSVTKDLNAGRAHEATAAGDVFCAGNHCWSDTSWGVEQGTEHLNLNSGLFYIKSNERTIGLMKRVAARLEKEKAWDQSVYNQEIFYLSHGDHIAPGVTVRVMDIFLFMNSKVLFKQVSHNDTPFSALEVMIL